MTLKSSSKTMKMKVPQPGFTASENVLIDQLEKKKKTKHTAKEEEGGKVGKMFKKKKQDSAPDAADDLENEAAQKKMKKGLKKQKTDPVESEEEFEVVKAPKKKTPNTDVIPGFSAPKTAKKRHAEASALSAKKAKFAENAAQEKKEVSKKELKVERKKKENAGRFDLSIKAKKLWEELRMDETPKDKQLALSAELYGIIKGHTKELVFAHDTVRVIECLFEKASQEVKDALFNELKSHTINLARSQYAHFYLLKVLRHGNKEQRNYIIEALSGKVVYLMKHKIAAKVVETAYNDWANATQRALLSQEFYGPEFKLFKDAGVTTLASALAKFPEKKDSFLKFMSAAIEPIISKGVFNHSLLHRLMGEFITHCSATERAEMILSLRQAVVQILHTRDGARVGMTCLWHGTQKDRKEIIKSFKGHVAKICQEEHGHMVLMALFDAVDDTKLVSKAIVSEIATNWREIAVHDHGRKVVMYLLAGRDPTYTSPQVTEILKQGDGNAASKKDGAVRRQELLQYAAPAWLDAVTAEPEIWLKDNRNCIVLAAILKFCPGAKELAAAFKAIASIVCQPLDQDARNAFSSEGEKIQHWVEQPAVHMILKQLIKQDKLRSEPPYFSLALLEALDDPEEVKGWLSCNRGSFLFVNMLETELDSVKSAVTEKVSSLRKFMQKQNNKGADILDSKLSNFR